MSRTEDPSNHQLSGPSITVEIRESWGRRRAYPMCHESKLFAQIAQTKTLRAMDLQHIHDLGFGIWDQSSRSELQIDSVE